jgi:UDP-GlcNAc:undecaprenyl-phosphate GlcNAc-1-phosphate transferase
MIWFVAMCVVPAFIISWSVTYLMRIISPRIGLIDQPAARKVHSNPTPLGGGVGIVMGFVVPISLGLIALAVMQRDQYQALVPSFLTPHLDGAIYRAPQMGAILLGAVILAVMGLMDDIRPLSWRLRLMVQFLVAGGVIAAGIKATVFVSYSAVGILITLIWLVVLINSFNFLDNMDALSSGIGLIAAILFSIIMLTMTSEPRWLVGGALLILVGSLSGFLVHNYPPAKIFMGDAGSTVIGFLLGCFTLLGTFYDQQSIGTHVMLAPLCILAVPLYDITSVIAIRLKRGLSPFQPDKNHFSHRLVELGLPRKHAVHTVHLATLTTGLGGILLYCVPNWNSAWIVIGLVCCVLGMIGVLEYAGRKKSEKLFKENQQLTAAISASIEPPLPVTPAAPTTGSLTGS